MADSANNLFVDLPVDTRREQFATLLEGSGFKLERIVSHGQATPPGEWYDQGHGEWVVLLQGSAALLIEGDAEPRLLQPGDCLYLPAHQRHRVEWTKAGSATIWLALHHWS